MTDLAELRDEIVRSLRWWCTEEGNSNIAKIHCEALGGFVKWEYFLPMVHYWNWHSPDRRLWAIMEVMQRHVVSAALQLPRDQWPTP